jgi:ppGpp synthetase/RelA/SpoT-type nucleotidyltranferase
MKEIFKAILKYLFANTKLDEKVADVLETAKTEAAKLDKKFDDLKEDVEKEEVADAPTEDIDGAGEQDEEKVATESIKKTTKKG